MFGGCSGLTSLDISNFNTAKVTDMTSMFLMCSGLTSLDLNNFNTENVKDMSSMFYMCSGLTSLDLSNFNTENVTVMYYMFGYCSGLTTIYSNDIWSATDSSTDMFSDCTSLQGGDGTPYSYLNLTVDFAHPNAGGYFTKKYENFTAVDVDGDTQYWQTYYTDTRDVVADENITVYTAKVKGDDVTIYEVEDNIIPQGQAVLMRSTIQDPVLYTATTAGTGDFSKNDLRGSQREVAANSFANEGTVYTLANGSEGLNFYRFAGDNLKANRAFLVVPSVNARVIKMHTEGEATGISENNRETITNNRYYDLQGRSVEQPTKGLYIVNGKKVVRR
ncbi:MAG: DUF285 domain-containing protein [Prevotella sp.]|nr:DUF285 domain-containing protein [Prevotella sp.]